MGAVTRGEQKEAKSMSKSNSIVSTDTEINEHGRSFHDVEAERQEPMETGMIARGRTLLRPKDGPTRIVGFTKDRIAIHSPHLEELKEGDSFTAPVSEILRLRELGYIFDPERVATDAEAGMLDKNGAPVAGNGGVGFVNARQ
jgi:hypothetical protein